jgi:hypothetical protein
MRKTVNEPASASGGRPPTPLRDVASSRFDAAGSASAAFSQRHAEAHQSRGDSGSVEDGVGSPRLCPRRKKSLAASRRGGETSSAVTLRMAAEGGRDLPTEPLGALSVGLKWASSQPCPERTRLRGRGSSLHPWTGCCLLLALGLGTFRVPILPRLAASHSPSSVEPMLSSGEQSDSPANGGGRLGLLPSRKKSSTPSHLRCNTGKRGVVSTRLSTPERQAKEPKELAA